MVAQVLCEEKLVEEGCGRDEGVNESVFALA